MHKVIFNRKILKAFSAVVYKKTSRMPSITTFTQHCTGDSCPEKKYEL